MRSRRAAISRHWRYREWLEASEAYSKDEIHQKCEEMKQYFNSLWTVCAKDVGMDAEGRKTSARIPAVVASELAFAFSSQI